MPPVQIEELEDPLVRLDCIESRLKSTTVVNEQIIDAVNNLTVDFKHIVDQENSLPIRSIKIPDDNTTSSQRTQTDHSTETTLADALRAQNRIYTVELLFSNGQPPARLTLMDLRLLLLDDVSKVPKEDMKRSRKYFVKINRRAPHCLPLPKVNEKALPLLWNSLPY